MMDFLNSPPEPALPPPPIEEMAAEVIRDLTQSFHWNTDSWWYGLMNKLMKIPATKFSRLMREGDLKVATHSVWEAARELLPRFSGGWEVEGGKNIPKEGPLLVVSNHPGAVDSVAAMAVLERPDAHLVANERPTLKVLPNTSEHLVYLDPSDPGRIGVLRNLIGLLERGQTVVLFPRGALEPEPALYPGALDSLKFWSESLGVFLNRVPETMLQLVLTRNIITPQAWTHPLAKLGKNERQRHQISMVLQLSIQAVFNSWKVPIKMTLPEPVTAQQLAPDLDPHALNRAIQQYVGGEMEKTFEYL